MKTFTKIAKIYFSPSSTTRKIVDEIANKFEGTQEEYDLLNVAGGNSPKEFDDDTLVIVGMPIFAGRLPKTASTKLMNFKGENIPAIAVVNYGNINIGDALIELNDILKENGFTIVGTGATVSQHSIVTDVAAGRPDEKDLEKLNEFVEKCREKLDSEEFEDIEVPGNKPYCEYKKVPLAPICDESLCTYCYECVSSCPEDARYFTGDLFEGMKERFLTNFNQRKESEFYL